MYRTGCTVSYAPAGIAEGEGSHDRLTQPSSVLPGNCVDRIRYTPCMSIPSVVALHNERLSASDCELVHAPDYPAHGIVCQRPHGLDPIPLPYLLPGGKNGIPGNRPVYNLCRRTPGKQLSGLHPLAFNRGMGLFRPHNGLSIAAGYQDKALPGGGCTVVCGHQLPVLDFVSQGG